MTPHNGCSMAWRLFLQNFTVSLLALVIFFFKNLQADALGSMSSVAAVYGSNGPTFCGLQSSEDGSAGDAQCFGSNAACVYGAPLRLALSGLTAGNGFVCGLSVSSQLPYCWGNNIYVGFFVKGASLVSITAGASFSCGLFASNKTATCWGDETGSGVISETPRTAKFKSIAAGGYHGITTRGIPSNSSQPLCWGSQFPVNYSNGSPPSVDCTSCGSSTSNCSASCAPYPSHSKSIQTPIIVGELAIAIVVVGSVLAVAIFPVRYKLAKLAAAAASNERTSGSIKKQKGVPLNQKGSFRSSFRKEKVRPEMEEPNMSRAEVFSYQELEKATGGFGKEYEVGRGSFSCVFKGVLSDGRMVAGKRAAAVPSQQQKDSNEFRNELDLLSRLNHAHLLTLLGFCDDGEERLLVYEFMSNGTLHEQLHTKKNKAQVGWVRRVTIAVQAARGLEYLHGYACPPVIHRDIKSSNILLDEEWNARISDFGLSLLGPLNSNSALSELPAGTLGYLDPEYYRLHYLTTKSDVYSFGVLLLEILSGRKAIDMQYDEGNIVEWAVPLIKSGQVGSVLDPRLVAPPNLEAVQKIARVAARCVKMRGKDRPSMDKVTTSLERALAMLMGTFSEAHPILPSEVVLGSNRLHRKSSQKSSCRSALNVDSSGTTFADHGYHRHPSSVTFPSINSSQRRGSVSDYDAGGSLDIVVHLPVHDAELCKEYDHPFDASAERKSEIGPASPGP